MAEEKKAKLTEEELDKVTGGLVQPQSKVIIEKFQREGYVEVVQHEIIRFKTPEMKQQMKETAQRAREMADIKLGK